MERGTCPGQSSGWVTHTRGRNIPFSIFTSLGGLRVFAEPLKEEEKKREAQWVSQGCPGAVTEACCAMVQGHCADRSAFSNSFPKSDE